MLILSWNGDGAPDKRIFPADIDRCNAINCLLPKEDAEMHKRVLLSVNWYLLRRVADVGPNYYCGQDVWGVDGGRGEVNLWNVGEKGGWYGKQVRDSKYFP